MLRKAKLRARKMVRPLSSLGARAAALLAKLPAARSALVFKRLMDVEMSDPSGRADINRAGLAVGLIGFTILAGRAVTDMVASLLPWGEPWPWTMPALLLVLAFCVVHSLVCAKILTES